jgi:multidrug resistance efflux pump
MSRIVKVSLTGLVVLLAVAAIAFKYWDYLRNPWTRDGQVRANVIQVAPRISGPIVDLPIRDNQFVRAGDLLFRIDPRTYEAAVDQAAANLDSIRDQLSALEQEVEAAKAVVEQSRSLSEQARALITSTQAEVERTQGDFGRQAELLQKGFTPKATYDQAKAAADEAQADLERVQAQLTQARAAELQAQAQLARTVADLGAPGDENAQLRAARAALETAQLDLQFTEVRAAKNGYVTNLNLRLGSQAVANQPALALVDADSFWVSGYFRETLVGRIRPGDPAVVTLMSYPETPVLGVVDSIGWGIAQQDGSTGQDLLPAVSPTFEWIRLAQRIPVRVHLEQLPEGIELRVGTTASVLVMTDGSDDRDPPPAPALLQ